MWYNTKLTTSAPEEYKSTVVPVMTPEQKFVYEIFVLLKIHVRDPARLSFSKTYVCSIEGDIKTELRRDKLETSMSNGPATCADDILATINEVYE